MADEKDRYIRFDWAIKRLLRQKANFAVLEGFLTVFIGEKITIDEILESEGNQEDYLDKFNRVDIKARNSKGEIIIIEVQNTFEANFMERVLYGVAKTITEHINLGDDYSHVVKVYSISILYFDLGKGKDYLYHGQNKFVGVHTKDELEINQRQKDALVRKSPKEIFPEYILIRVNEFDEVATSPLQEWMAYLKEGIIREGTTAPGLPEAKARLHYYNMSSTEQKAYERHMSNVVSQRNMFSSAHDEGYYEGRTEGMAEGMEKGRKEGEEKGRKEGIAEGIEKGREDEKRLTARNLKKLGLHPDLISQATGLSVEELGTLD